MSGVWVRKGREGVYQARRKDSTSCRRSTQEDDGKGPFAAERLRNKLDVVRQGNEQLLKQQKDKAIVNITQPLDIQSVLALSSPSGLNERAPASSLAAQLKMQDSRRSGETSESDAEDEPTPTNDLSTLLGVTSGKTGTNQASAPSKSQSALNESSARRTAMQTASQSRCRAFSAQRTPCEDESKGLASGHASAQSAHRRFDNESKAPPAKPLVQAPPDMGVVIDGRTRRIMESLTREAERLVLETNINFEEELSTQGNKAKKQMLQEAFKKKARKIAKLRGELDTQVNRIKASKNKGPLTELQDTFSALSAKATLLADFNTLVSGTNPSPQLYKEKKEALSDMGIIFGPAYDKYELTLQGYQCMMRDDANGLCALCYNSSDYMCRLAQAGHNKHDLVALASGLALEAVLGVTSNLTTADLVNNQQKSESKRTLLSIYQACTSHARNDGFLVDVEGLHLSFLQLVDPVNLPVRELHSLLHKLADFNETGAAGEIPAIPRFFLESAIGVKFVTFAETTRDAGKEQLEREDEVAEVEASGLAVLNAPVFLLNEEDFDPFALRRTPFLTFQSESESLLSKLAQRKSRSKSECTLTVRVKKRMNAVWMHVRRQFGEMYQALCDDAFLSCMEAVAAGGLDKSSLDKEGSVSVIDLEFHYENLKMEPVMKAEILQTATQARSLKMVEGFQEFVDAGLKVFSVLKELLIFHCPRVQVLYKAETAIHKLCSVDGVKHALQLIGFSGKSIDSLLSQVTPLLNTMQDAESSKVGTQVLGFVDSVLAKECVKLSHTQIHELVGRLKLSTACCKYLASFLRFASDMATGDAASGHVASTCLQASKAVSALEALKKSEDIQAALAAITAPRFEAMEKYLRDASGPLHVKASKLQGGARERLGMIVVSLQEDLKEVAFHDEASMLAFMQVGASHLAERQSKVEKELLNCEKAAKSGGGDLEEEWKQSDILRDAEKTVGKCLLLVCFYACITLFRSPAFGKKNDEGKKSMANLKKVLNTINGHTEASKCEGDLQLSLLKEMREVAGIPPAAPDATPASPAETPASAIGAQQEVQPLSASGPALATTVSGSDTDLSASGPALATTVSGHAPASTVAGSDTALAEETGTVDAEVVGNGVGDTGAEHPEKKCRKRSAASSTKKTPTKKLRASKEQGEAANVSKAKPSAPLEKKPSTEKTEPPAKKKKASEGSSNKVPKVAGRGKKNAVGAGQRKLPFPTTSKRENDVD